MEASCIGSMLPCKGSTSTPTAARSYCRLRNLRRELWSLQNLTAVVHAAGNRDANDRGRTAGWRVVWCGGSRPSRAGSLYAGPRAEPAHTGKNRPRAAVVFRPPPVDGPDRSPPQCHDPARGHADNRPLSAGVLGRKGRRNAPALINRGYGRSFFWDGRIDSKEEHPVLKPIENADEMNLPLRLPHGSGFPQTRSHGLSPALSGRSSRATRALTVS